MGSDYWIIISIFNTFNRQIQFRIFESFAHFLDIVFIAKRALQNQGFWSKSKPE